MPTLLCYCSTCKVTDSPFVNKQIKHNFQTSLLKIPESIKARGLLMFMPIIPLHI